MSVTVNNQALLHPKKLEESFIDRHFATVALVVSALVVFLLSPLAFLFGSVGGLFFSMNYDLRPKGEEKIATASNVVFAIIGATAALLRLTPAGYMGGFLFQAIPLLSSFAIGNTFYRAIARAK